MSPQTGTYEVAEERMADLFSAWQSAGVPACVWKSADRWQEGLQGNTDFDLLVAADHLREAQRVLVQQGWFPVGAERWRSYPGLFDYVSLRNGLNHHIHLHAHIVAGEKLVKSLRPPLAGLYLDHVRGGYPPIVQPELEFVLYLVRMVVKINWIDRLGAVRRLETFSIYRNYLREFELLRQAADRERLSEVLMKPALGELPRELIMAAHADLSNIGWFQRRVLKRGVRSWRFGGSSKVAWHKFWRALARRRDGVGKTCDFRAPTIAICGADGSGKSTLSVALEQHLSRHLKVSRYYMGSNLKEAAKLRCWVRRAVWWPYLIIRKICKMLGWHAGRDIVEGRYQNLKEVLLKREKSARLQRARADSASGVVVIFERFPLFTPHGDDHEPSLIGAETGMPDILVLLEVAEATALSRRAEDPVDVIKAKVQAFAEVPALLKGHNTRLVVCAESDSVEVRVKVIADLFDDVCLRIVNESMST